MSTDPIVRDPNSEPPFPITAPGPAGTVPGRQGGTDRAQESP
ncbi:hypothetical protein [Pseudonocardia sp. C8]|nr:hypothetical protein [Pseudonocardia sp. C8]